MSQLTHSLDRYTRAFEATRATSKKGTAALMAQEAKLILNQAIDLTPTPRHRAGSRAATVYGRKVIERYFNYAARPLNHRKWRKKAWSTAIRRQNAPALRKLLSHLPKGHKLKKYRVEPWSMAIVNRASNNRGQVRKIQKVLTFDSRQRKADLRNAKADIGKAKAGWAAGLLALRGKYGASATIPASLQTHVGEGRVKENLLANPAFIHVANLSAWAKRSDEANRIRNAALHLRAKKLERRLAAYHTARLERAAKKSSQTPARPS